MATPPTSSPLADRLRPRQLSDFVGQAHIIGPGQPLRGLIKKNALSSVIFWGPPGSGKTTLAHLIAEQLQADFIPFSAVTSGIADLRKVIAHAEQNQRLALRTIVFIDEIHRWNKSQQDALLPHVEKGTIILIGATTENPSFEVNSALLSRAHVYRLHELTAAELKKVLQRALTDTEHGLGKQKLKVSKEAERFLLDIAAGDARSLLNTLEVAAETLKSGSTVELALLEQVLAQKAVRYDKKGEDHYNVISAFIKSMRGTDPNAAIYYLARMIEAGEDPLFIARRLVIFASEDVGNADPHALLVAQSAFAATHQVGMPESRIILAQATTYLASAPKSNASYTAISAAQAEVQRTGALPVPLWLRNAPTQLMRDEGYHKGYEYAHNAADSEVSHHHIPDKLVGTVFYEPKNVGHEANFKEKLDDLRVQRSRKPKK